MTEHNTTTEKRIVIDWLSLSATTAKRVTSGSISTPLSKKTAEGATTPAKEIRADGGESVEDDQQNTCSNGNVHCDGPNGKDLPCFACYEVGE